MNVLEVAIYAMVIGGANHPTKCVENDLGAVNCTNGLAATAGARWSAARTTRPTTRRACAASSPSWPCTA